MSAVWSPSARNKDPRYLNSHAFSRSVSPHLTCCILSCSSLRSFIRTSRSAVEPCHCRGGCRRVICASRALSVLYPLSQHQHLHTSSGSGINSALGQMLEPRQKSLIDSPQPCFSSDRSGIHESWPAYPSHSTRNHLYCGVPKTAFIFSMGHSNIFFEFTCNRCSSYSTETIVRAIHVTA